MQNKESFYGMTWSPTGTNSQYFSVMLASSNCGGFYIELLSDTATGIDVSVFHEIKEQRFDFTNFSRPQMDFHPLKVSRATTKVPEMISFYTQIIEGTEVKHEVVNGVEIGMVKLRWAPDMLMQFVDRPPKV